MRIATVDGDQAEVFRAHPGDAGIDLRSGESFTLAMFERRCVGTGVVVEVPEGCVGLLMPRSGLARDKGVTLLNTGVIDSGYRGEVGATLINLGSAPVTIERGERVCQLVVVPCDQSEVSHVPRGELTGSERGDGGFGSSGRL